MHVRLTLAPTASFAHVTAPYALKSHAIWSAGILVSRNKENNAQLFYRTITSHTLYYYLFYMRLAFLICIVYTSPWLQALPKTNNSFASNRAKDESWYACCKFKMTIFHVKHISDLLSNLLIKLDYMTKFYELKKLIM